MANHPSTLAHIDHVQRKRPRGLELIEDACWKIAYRYGSYRIVVSRGDDGKVRLAAGLEQTRSRECLATAISFVEPIVPYAKTIIDRGRKQYGPRWEDLDVGAPIWVACEAPYGVDTLLHELNHHLRVGNCLHDPEGPPLCFEGLGDLPKRKHAFVEQLPLSAVEGRSGFETAQRLYFVVGGEESVVMLHDELLAYAIDADVNTALVAAAMTPTKLIVLPLMAYLTVHYWELIKRERPDDFERLLGRSGSIRAELDRLLARAERSYGAWELARATLKTRSQQQQARGEAKLWQRYLETKRRLFTP